MISPGLLATQGFGGGPLDIATQGFLSAVAPEPTPQGVLLGGILARRRSELLPTPRVRKPVEYVGQFDAEDRGVGRFEGCGRHHGAFDRMDRGICDFEVVVGRAGTFEGNQWTGVEFEATAEALGGFEDASATPEVEIDDTVVVAESEFEGMAEDAEATACEPMVFRVREDEAAMALAILALTVDSR